MIVIIRSLYHVDEHNFLDTHNLIIMNLFLSNMFQDMEGSGLQGGFGDALSRGSQVQLH